MWTWHDSPGGWGWFWMAFMMAIVWVPLLLVAVWAIRQWTSGSDGSARSPGDIDAREIARRAYARGEYSRERFQEIMADLAHRAEGNNGHRTA